MTTATPIDLDQVGSTSVHADTLKLLHRLLRDVPLGDLSEEDATDLACALLGAELRMKHRRGDTTATIDFRGWLPHCAPRAESN